MSESPEQERIAELERILTRMLELGSFRVTIEKAVKCFPNGQMFEQLYQQRFDSLNVAAIVTFLNEQSSEAQSSFPGAFLDELSQTNPTAGHPRTHGIADAARRALERKEK